MRKLKRSIARANMKRAGYQHINRKGADKQSFFSLTWRKFVY